MLSDKPHTLSDVDPVLQERAERLREAFDAPEPTTWRPDDDSEGHPRLLIGELMAVQDGRTSWGERQIAVIRDTEGRLWNVWLLHAVIIGEFVRQQPKLGEMLAISYDGRVDGGSGASGYEKYRLIVDRPGGQVSWRSVEGAAVAAAPAAPAAPATFAGTEPEQASLMDAPTPEPTLCEKCGFANGRHADGCPEDIPF